MTEFTKKEMFAQVIAMVNGEEVRATKEQLITFAEHEIELLNRKSGAARKPTKTQIENEIIKNNILDILADNDRPMTISDIMEDDRLKGLRNQKISALVTQLKKADKVVRTEDKKKAYFTLA